MVAIPETNRITPSELDNAAAVERQLLGSVLRSGSFGGDGPDDAAEVLCVADFAVHAHGEVFKACIDLRAAGNPVTLVSVYEQMRAAGTLAELGSNGGAWLAEVFDAEQLGTQTVYYARRVKEAAARRNLHRVAAEIMIRVQGEAGRPAADTLADCEQLLFNAGITTEHARGPVQSPELVREALERIDSIGSGNEARGIATGFADLDRYLGGLKPGQMLVIGARPGVGKTSLAAAINANSSGNGVGSLFFSLEMTRAELMERVLSMRSGVRLDAIQTGKGLSSEQAERIANAGSLLRTQPFEIDDTANVSVARIASTVRNAVRRRSIGLVCVDYLQLIEPENRKDNRVQQVGTAARQLKILARTCGIPIVVLCQLNRESENRTDGKPKLSDLRESGEIEQHADAVVLLGTQPNQQETEPVWLVDATVAKNRGGPTGMFTLAYRRVLTRYENAAR